MTLTIPAPTARSLTMFFRLTPDPTPDPTGAEVSELYGIARANCATIHPADRMRPGAASDYWQYWDRVRYACETWLHIRHPGGGEEATELRRTVIRMAVGLPITTTTDH